MPATSAEAATGAAMTRAPPGLQQPREPRAVRQRRPWLLASGVRSFARADRAAGVRIRNLELGEDGRGHQVGHDTGRGSRGRRSVVSGRTGSCRGDRPGLIARPVLTCLAGQVIVGWHRHHLHRRRRPQASDVGGQCRGGDRQPGPGLGERARASAQVPAAARRPTRWSAGARWSPRRAAPTGRHAGACRSPTPAGRPTAPSVRPRSRCSPRWPRPARPVERPAAFDSRVQRGAQRPQVRGRRGLGAAHPLRG